MINFHSFLKFLNRNKVYTVINVFGLAVSLMFVILIFVYAWQEFTVDKFQADRERIYVEYDFGADGEDGPGDGLPVAYWLKERFPDIEEICPVITTQFHGGKSVIWHDTKITAKMSCAESNFFTFFSFPLKSGAPGQVLQDEYSAVVSETFARKLFGSEEPIGQSIKISEETSVTVTGVMYDISRSVIPYADLIVRVERAEEFNHFISKQNASNAGASVVFLKMYPGKDMNAHRDEVLEMYKERYWIFYREFCTDVCWKPLREAYFSAGGSLIETGDKRFVSVLFAVGLLILFFAIFNYINLTVAQSGSRAKEMATRRLLGSSRGGIVFRLVVEALLLTAVSYLLALLLATAVKPVSERLLQTTLDFSLLLSPACIALAVGFVVLIGALTGILPAVLISAAKPVEVVRGSFRRRSKMVFSKYFIGFQNAITIVMLAVSLVMVLQMRHLIHAPLGYNTLNVIDITYVLGVDDKVLMDKLSSVPSVKRVGTSQGTPFDGGNNSSGDYCGRQLSVQWIFMDTAAFHMLGFQKVYENSRKQTMRQDDRYDFEIYPTAFAMQEMGLPQDADEFDLGGQEKIPVCGVIGNFRRANILRKEQPFVVGVTNDVLEDAWNLLVEVQGDPVRAYDEVMGAIRELTDGEVEAKFIDQEVRESFDSQRRMTQIVSIFTCMAILISVLGLVAMSIYFIRQRAQEVAVRKVFGADNRTVLFRVVRSFLLYVLYGFVVAFPVSWYIAVKWRSGYSYRIAFNPLYIVAAGLFCMAVSFVAVYFQSRRAAHANPVESLREV
ncbi:MAG: ABC transporter permease [Bacteroides sp.]|nr:ABC transporter permease [Ruminococcus flavefaciens]MCM1554042.1 ABC transporter permease [Bacteroides sp.]